MRTTLTAPVRLPQHFCTVDLCGLAERADAVLLSAILRVEKGLLAWPGEDSRSLCALVDHAETLEPLMLTCMSDDIGYDAESVREMVHVRAVVPTASVPPEILAAGVYQLLALRMQRRRRGGWIRFGGDDGDGWGFASNDPLGYTDNGAERTAVQLFNCCRLSVRVTADEAVDEPAAASRQSQCKHDLHISATNYAVHRAAYWQNVDCSEARAAGTARIQIQGADGCPWRTALLWIF